MEGRLIGRGHKPQDTDDTLIITWLKIIRNYTFVDNYNNDFHVHTYNTVAACKYELQSYNIALQLCWYSVYM